MQFVYLLMHEWEEYQQQTHVWMLILNTSPTTSTKCMQGSF